MYHVAEICLAWEYARNIAQVNFSARGRQCDLVELNGLFCTLADIFQQGGHGKKRVLPIRVIVFHPSHTHGTLDFSKFEAGSPADLHILKNELNIYLTQNVMNINPQRRE